MPQELLSYSRKALIFAKQILGNHSDAEDVVQASIEKALAHPSAPSGGVDLQKWLYRVVRNGAIDKIRQQARETSIEEIGSAQQADSQLISSFSTEPEQYLQRMQLKRDLDAALTTLTAGQREIIVLRDYHQASYEEIAEILSIAKGTVMSRLHRARMSLRERLLTRQNDGKKTISGQNKLNEVEHEVV